MSSRAAGVLARLPIPTRARRPVLGFAARILGIDLTEAAEPLTTHRSIAELFTRRLKPDVRTWPADAGVVGSPVDGIVGQSGRVREGRMLQAKGREYTVAELLAADDLAARFVGGSYLTIYLSPRHYHRVHAPVGGTLSRARHLPGRLLPVNAPAVRMIDRLFPRNERLVCLIDGSRLGTVAVVAVGAFNVGRIGAAFDNDLVTNRWGARAETRVYHPPIEIARGQELMTFHLGSTVVLLFERPVPLTDRPPGTPVRLGEPLTDPYIEDHG